MVRVPVDLPILHLSAAQLNAGQLLQVLQQGNSSMLSTGKPAAWLKHHISGCTDKPPKDALHCRGCVRC